MNFIVYGVSGWLGRVTIYYLQEHFPDAKIIPISSSTKEIEINGIIHKCYNLDEALKLKKTGDFYLLNYAFILQEKVKNFSESEYESLIIEIRNGATRLINYFKPKKIIYSSSGAVYKDDNLYGEMKLKDENYFSELSKNIGSNILIPRIFNIGGLYINKYDVYALSNFICQAMQNDKIDIKAQQRVYRSYVDVTDLLKIFTSWIEDSENFDYCFDSANPDGAIEMDDLANITFKQLNMDKNINRDSISNEENRYCGDIEAQTYLTNKYNINISSHNEIVANTINYIKNAK